MRYFTNLFLLGLRTQQYFLLPAEDLLQLALIQRPVILVNLSKVLLYIAFLAL